MSSWAHRRITRLGGNAVAVGRAIRELWMVYVSTIAGIYRNLRRTTGSPRGELLRQMYSIGNRSLFFIIVTLGFIGMVMTYEACLQLSRVTGEYSQVGATIPAADRL